MDAGWHRARLTSRARAGSDAGGEEPDSVWKVGQEVWEVGQAVCRWDRQSGRWDRRSTDDSAAASGPWSSMGCSKLARTGVSAFSVSLP